MATNAKPTPLDVERYIELEALWVLMSGDALFSDDDLLPVRANHDGGDITIHKDGDSFSYEQLFARVIPDEIEDTTEASLINGRVDLLVARLLRSIDPEHVKEQAAYFENLAAGHLAKAKGGGDDA